MRWFSMDCAVSEGSEGELVVNDEAASVLKARHNEPRALCPEGGVNVPIIWYLQELRAL
jgi:hypothetical protein